MAHQLQQFLILFLGPAHPGLIGEPPEAAVAHLSIPSFDLSCNLLKTCVLILTEFQEESVLILGPGFLSLLVALFLKVLACEDDPLVILAQTLQIYVLIIVRGVLPQKGVI